MNRLEEMSGLLPSESRVLDAIVDTGSNKSAAKALGIEVCTLESHMTRIRQKFPHLTRLQICIHWAIRRMGLPAGWKLTK